MLFLFLFNDFFYMKEDQNWRDEKYTAEGKQCSENSLIVKNQHTSEYQEEAIISNFLIKIA